MGPANREVPTGRSNPLARLEELAEIQSQRAEVYGNYKIIGRVMDALYPDGFLVKGPDEWNRIILFLMIQNKLARISNGIPTSSHRDSLDDISIYAQMLANFEDDLDEA